MTDHHDGPADDILIVGDRVYRLTLHVLNRIEQRQIDRQWLIDVLENWVARKYMPTHRSVNYFGIIPERYTLFMVAVSEHDLKIPSAFFHSAATDQYRRGRYDFFDEVRNHGDRQV